MEAYVEPHLSWRLLGPEDTPALEEFREQLTALDDSVISVFAAEITESDAHVAEGQAVGGWDAYDSLSAYGVSYVAGTDPLRVYLLGGIHPVHRHQAIGSALLRWQVAGATDWRDLHHPGEELWLGCYAELGRPGLERVAHRLGFEPERYCYDLIRELEKPLGKRVVPNVSIRPFTADDAEEVRLLHNNCFQPIGGAEVGEEQWHARLSDPDFRPEWSVVALDGSEIIGYAMSATETAVVQTGWTERFGVHPDYRGRGVALAMLAQAMTAMRAAGCVEAGIGIDTPDGFAMSKLTAELGYTTRDAVALLSKVVPGAR